MKNIKIYLIFFIVSSIAFAHITPKFGIKNNFSYIDMKETEFIPNSILSNDTYFYLGFEYLNNNFYFSFKPALRIYTKDNRDIIYDNGNFIKQTDNKAYISFNFDELQFTYINDILGFYIGKRKFHFGEGFNRQYMFVGESVLYNDFDALYNSELNFYQNNITHSIGFITDTKSIDLLEEPKYYRAWYYLKYSSSHLGLMAITKYVLVQNKEPKIVNVGNIKLKPGFPQKIQDVDELRKKYPVFDEKLKSGSIVILDAKTAEIETQNIEQELEKRLKKANMV